MRSSLVSSGALMLAIAQYAAAQTSTSCNPLDTTCPADPALGKTVNIDFTQGNLGGQFTELPGTSLTYDGNGAKFVIESGTNAPTIVSNWYFFFGSVEAVVQAAPGTGIVSSLVLESDDLDEIDWEWIGSDTTQCQSNYFGKGDTTTYNRGGFSPVGNPQTTFHTYGWNWSAEKIDWLIDGQVVRTLNYADAQGGSRFPQTPMRVKIGTWCAGLPTTPEGTREWAGGLTDFSQAPFTMWIKSLTVTDSQTGASQYVYGDKSGDWQSIDIQKGGSSAQVSSASASAPSSKSASTPGSTSTTKAPSTSSASSNSAPTTSKDTTSSTLVLSSTAIANSTIKATQTAGTTTAASGTIPSPKPSTGTGNKFGPSYVILALAAAVGYTML